MALVFLNFSNGVKTRPWQHLPRFARTFQRANDFMPFMWKASEVYLNEFTAAKYKYSEKFTIKSALFHSNQRKCKSEFLSGTQERSFLSDS